MFLKDLALPLVLAVLAYTFQHLQQERSRVDETINLLLPRAHENAVNHLLPVVGATTQLLARYARATDAAGEEKAAAIEEGLFFLLSAVNTMRNLPSSGGGIFFADLVGEDVTIECWRTLRYRVERRLGSRDLPTVLDRWSSTETYSSMRSNFAHGKPHKAAFRRLELRFETWLPDPEFRDFDQRLFKAFGYIMQREIDRLYWTWYGEKPALERQAIDELLGALDGAPIEDARRTDLRKALEDYLKSGK